MDAPYPQLASPLTLPCGAVLRNRLIKAAMTEQLAAPENRVSDTLVRLYEAWGRGGAAVLLTGNVMVDHRALEGPRNVAVEEDADLPGLRRWAEAAQANGAQLWMQISHPGRQTPSGVSTSIVAPSATPIEGDFRFLFTKPTELTEVQITDLIDRFENTARLAKDAGFAGVQIHSAHGYLCSQFLSPRSNRRTDDWGGPLENRMRFLVTIVRRTRQKLGPDYPISVKLNSSDFMRGGFTEEESRAVVAAIAAEGVDLLEISGGTYENRKMLAEAEQHAADNGDGLESALFIDYARSLGKELPIKTMLTGGLRNVPAMEGLVADGVVDIIGLARPFCLLPNLGRAVLEDGTKTLPNVSLRSFSRPLSDLLQSLWHQEQMRLIAANKPPNPAYSKTVALIKGLWNAFGPKPNRRR